jgi:hypothetical protein
VAIISKTRFKESAMSYFTHEQLSMTVSFLYPQAQQGVNFRAAMYVADSPAFVPLSDAWIEGWAVEGVEQPDVEYLKRVYSENNLGAGPTPPSGEIPVTES